MNNKYIFIKYNYIVIICIYIFCICYNVFVFMIGKFEVYIIIGDVELNLMILCKCFSLFGIIKYYIELECDKEMKIFCDYLNLF